MTFVGYCGGYCTTGSESSESSDLVDGNCLMLLVM